MKKFELSEEELEILCIALVHEEDYCYTDAELNEVDTLRNKLLVILRELQEESEDES